MEQKFKNFLEEKFRIIPPTTEAKNYRIKLLYQLKDKAQQLKLDGINDENLIYIMAINSLGDIETKILEFEKKRLNPEPVKSLIKKVTAFTIMYFLLFVTIFITIGVLTKAWSKVWLILVGGIFIAIIAIFLTISFISAKKKKFIISRIFITPSCVLLFVLIYLFLLMLTHLEYDWFTMLIMVIAILLADTLFAFITKSRTKLISLTVFVTVSAVLIYVMLGVSKVLSWRLGWLIILFANIFNSIIFIIHLKPFGNKKLLNKDINDDNYTSWE